jgi:hypothetical protein
MLLLEWSLKNTVGLVLDSLGSSVLDKTRVWNRALHLSLYTKCIIENNDHIYNYYIHIIIIA